METNQNGNNTEADATPDGVRQGYRPYDTAEHLMKTWVETERQMWKNWIGMMRGVSISEAQGESRGNAIPGFQDWTQRMVESRELMGRFFALSMQAWKDLSPKGESSGDTGANHQEGSASPEDVRSHWDSEWQSLLNKYAQLGRSLYQQFPWSKAMPEDSGQLWQLYLQEVQKWIPIWTEPMLGALAPMSRAATGDRAALFELSNIYWEIYEKTIGNFVMSPTLGYAREYNKKLLKGFDAWVDLYKVTFDYQVVLADIWVKAFEELMQELASSEQKGKKIQSWQQLVSTWSNIADRVFAEAFRSDEALRIQGKFLNSLMAYKIHQRELMEILLKMNDVPIRSEVDEVHQSIYELRKEVKALKKSLAASQAEIERLKAAAIS
ncbi:MAG TPA: class III poly(R)-hydroxyalkanoic acid synthase subunit PhaE [Oscillatoriaceae cyanobacterium M33_DOE_052]|uniref:Poly(3-hydroxyalkanoate) polymerase subunit PhaE n=1 Tax=Planktothricoides sp. SpSt-374 TaxID=2282167 RepID=A0A7C3ZV75_9CYAN|nr:class III poly(R)-hydroxyalkanoic acid synthase subunit PhaE [Oscillatoriaceae cyanobacterium M33_DOE_052]